MFGLSKREKEDRKLRREGVIRTEDKFGNDIYIEDPKLKEGPKIGFLDSIGILGDILELVFDLLDGFDIFDIFD